jgi:hypothetical protein
MCYANVHDNINMEAPNYYVSYKNNVPLDGIVFMFEYPSLEKQIICTECPTIDEFSFSRRVDNSRVRFFVLPKSR